MTGDTRKALQLCLLAGANYVLFYGLSVFLARNLGIRGFEQYNVAVATVTLLASIATLGLEKYALRVLPGLLESREWEAVRGFVRFSIRVVMVVSLVLVVAYVVANWLTLSLLEAGPRGAVVLLVLLVPCIAIALFFVEVVSASGEAVRASVVYRLLLPTSAVALVATVYLIRGSISPRVAVACYGAGWVLSLVAIVRIARRLMREAIAHGVQRYERKEWIRRSVPFLIQSFVMTQFATSGIIVLEFLNSQDFVVGLYAACLQVAGFAVLLATSTNRFYAPKIALMIERKDFGGLKGLARGRHAWLVPVVVGFALKLQGILVRLNIVCLENDDIVCLT